MSSPTAGASGAAGGAVGGPGGGGAGGVAAPGSGAGAASGAAGAGAQGSGAAGGAGGTGGGVASSDGAATGAGRGAATGAGGQAAGAGAAAPGGGPGTGAPAAGAGAAAAAGSRLRAGGGLPCQAGQVCDVAYVGCFSDGGLEQVDARTPVQRTLDCAALANASARVYFGMEFPESDPSASPALCAPLERQPIAALKVDDSECERTVPFDGQVPLGGKRTAVYLRAQPLCFEERARFEPLNMPHQGRTIEPSAVNCQVRCARTSGCAHFTYWPEGICQLQDGTAVRMNDTQTIAGPAKCRRPGVTGNDSSSTSAASAPQGCMDLGYKWEPLDMHFQGRTDEESKEACQARCASVTACRHFTYYPRNSGCHLEDQDAQQWPAPGALSGPPICVGTRSGRPAGSLGDAAAGSPGSSVAPSPTGMGPPVDAPGGSAPGVGSPGGAPGESPDAGSGNLAPELAPAPGAEAASGAKYVGCFKNDDGPLRLTGDIQNKTLAQCEVLAKRAKAAYFAMEYQQGSDADGRAHCLPVQELPQEKVDNTECDTGGGQRLGTSYRMALYLRPEAWCFKSGKSMEPLNMQGQTRTVEPSAVNCQVRCQKTYGCRNFVWYPDGGCHLQDEAAQEHDDRDTFAGPVTCEAASGQRGSSSRRVGFPASAPQDFCVTPGYKWQPVNTDRWARTEEDSKEACQARCAVTDNCMHFTYFQDRGCFLQDLRAQREHDPAAFSGPPSCQAPLVAGGEPQTETSTSAAAAEGAADAAPATPAPPTVAPELLIGTPAQYVGCFKNEEGSPRLVGGIANKTVAQCQVTAKKARSVYFAMQFPQGSPEEGTAECRPVQQLPEDQVGDGECEGEAPIEGKRLGGYERMAVYIRPKALCFTSGKKLVPIQMDGQGRTVEASAVNCQVRCAKTFGCLSFVWFKDGGCFLQAKGTMTQEDTEATYGPGVCEGPASGVSSLFPASAPKDFCLTPGYKWMPLNMQGTDRTEEPTKEACQARCARTDNCMHFTYWRDRGCHLQDAWVQREHDREALSGPASCEAPFLSGNASSDIGQHAEGFADAPSPTPGPTPAPSPAATPEPSSEAFCFESGKRWEPKNMDGQGRTSEQSQLKCQVRCATTPNCRHFSYWPDGGCHLQDGNATQENEDRVVSGPNTCQATVV